MNIGNRLYVIDDTMKIVICRERKPRNILIPKRIGKNKNVSAKEEQKPVFGKEKEKFNELWPHIYGIETKKDNTIVTPKLFNILVHYSLIWYGCKILPNSIMSDF